MKYREDLPDGCPPEQARPVTSITTLFRLVSQYPPAEQDFDSVWKTQPERRRRLERCQSSGLSMFDSAEEARKRTSYNTLRDKIVCAVNVTPEAGPVLMTPAHHYTWWPLRNYGIIARGEEVPYENS